MAWAGITTHLRGSKTQADGLGWYNRAPSVLASDCNRGASQTQADGLGWYNRAPSVLASDCNRGLLKTQADGLGWYNRAPSLLASDLNQVLATQETARGLQRNNHHQSSEIQRKTGHFAGTDGRVTGIPETLRRMTWCVSAMGDFVSPSCGRWIGWRGVRGLVWSRDCLPYFLQGFIVHPKARLSICG